MFEVVSPATPKWVRHCARWLVSTAALLGLVAVAGYLAFGSQPGAPATRVELEVEAAPGMAPDWAIQGARIEENALNTWIYVSVQNRTNRPLPDAFFYAELLDHQGRFCFSGLFNLHKNLDGHRGPLEPGAVRVLYSISGNLASATEPQVIRVSAVHPAIPESEKPFSAAVPIRIPVSIWATGVPVPPDWQRFWLVSPLGQFDTPVLDLALVVADVDSQGRLNGAPVIQALNSTVRDWTEKLGDHLLFRPSMVSFLAQRSQTLILVRAVLRRWEGGEAVFNPRTSPWVRDFVKALQAKEVPPVNILTLYPCPADAPSAAPSGGQAERSVTDCVEYGGGGTDWSVDIWKPKFPGPRGLR